MPRYEKHWLAPGHLAQTAGHRALTAWQVPLRESGHRKYFASRSVLVGQLCVHENLHYTLVAKLYVSLANAAAV
jgi:hypothetical protein